MNPAERLNRLFTYDSWACQKMQSVLEEHKDFDLRDQAVAMFAHIVTSQMHWYARITGTTAGVTELWPETGLDECGKQLASMQPKWKTLIRENVHQPDRTISYQNSKGTTYNTMLSDILHHVIIHGQHHRAQISLMLRQSDIVPPATDFIFYLRETGA